MSPPGQLTKTHHRRSILLPGTPVPPFDPRHSDASLSPSANFSTKKSRPRCTVSLRVSLSQTPSAIRDISKHKIRCCSISLNAEFASRNDKKIAKKRTNRLRSRLQPLSQAKHLIHAHPHLGAKRKVGLATGLLVIPREFLKGAMVHPLASKQRVEQTAPSPAPFPNLPRARVRAASGRLMLARVCKLIAMATREDCSPIEDCHAPSAASSRTAKPDALTPVVAPRPLQQNGIFLCDPFLTRRTGPVLQNHPIIFRVNVNISHRLAIAGPPPIERKAPLQQTVSLQSPHVKLAIISRCFLG